MQGEENNVVILIWKSLLVLEQFSYNEKTKWGEMTTKAGIEAEIKPQRSRNTMAAYLKS